MDLHPVPAHPFPLMSFCQYLAGVVWKWAAQAALMALFFPVAPTDFSREWSNIIT